MTDNAPDRRAEPDEPHPGTQPTARPDHLNAPDPAAPAVTERMHPLTPLVRGGIVFAAILVGVVRGSYEDLRLAAERDSASATVFLWAGLGIVVLLAAATGFASWWFTRFVIDARELRVDSGLLWRRSDRVAFDHVQGVDVVQPLVARLFGMAELRVDVGGAQAVRLRYLGRGRAEQLRDLVLARSALGARWAGVGRNQYGTGVPPAPYQTGAPPAPYQTGAPPVPYVTGAVPAPPLRTPFADDPGTDTVVIRISLARLVLATVTSLDFIVLAAMTLASVAVPLAFGEPLAMLPALLAFGGVVWGFITRRVIAQYDYRLARGPHGVRISRGLTSTTNQSVPVRRIQAVQISQSLLWRPLGLFRVDVNVIGWQYDEGSDAGSERVDTILLPAGTWADVQLALRTIWPGASFEDVELRPAPARARWRYPLSAPFLGWGHDATYFVARHGWLRRRWQIVPHPRAQSVGLAAGPVARRLMLATVGVHVAGQPLTVAAPGADVAEARAALADLATLIRTRPDADVTAAR